MQEPMKSNLRLLFTAFSKCIWQICDSKVFLKLFSLPYLYLQIEKPILYSG